MSRHSVINQAIICSIAIVGTYKLGSVVIGGNHWHRRIERHARLAANTAPRVINTLHG